MQGNYRLYHLWCTYRPSVSMGYGEQHQNTYASTHHNANVIAENMLLNVSHDLSLQGATVRADNLLMNVGHDLLVESMRNTTESSAHGYNINAGLSFGNDSSYTARDGSRYTSHRKSKARCSNQFFHRRHQYWWKR